MASGGGSSGGGEVRLLGLDDVDKSTLANKTFPKYNSSTGMLEFTDYTLSGLDDLDKSNIGDQKFLKYNGTSNKFEFGDGFDPLAVNTNIIPITDVTYDLGSPTKRFRDLYLSGSTLHIGDSLITESNGTINIPSNSTMDGIPIARVPDLSTYLKIANAHVLLLTGSQLICILNSKRC